jgi:hypothetical protein
VFDGIDDVDVEAVTAAFNTVEVVTRGRAAEAKCPDCGRFSDRVHDRYERRLKDLPLAEQRLVIRSAVRRFLFEVKPGGRKRPQHRPAAVDDTFRAFDPHQVLLLSPSLDDWLPEDHLARFVADLVDEVPELSLILADYSEKRGYTGGEW